MAIDPKVLAAVRAAFPGAGSAAVVSLGAPVHDGQCHAEPLIGVPLAMLNRHGLIAGATGTGKTKTLQLLTEGLSATGVPVFVADIKGDVAGLAAPGEPGPRVEARAEETGVAWRPAGFPIELLSLSGKLGAQLRATVSSFGPLALGKVMGLNDTQSSVLSLVFKFCDDRRLPLLDFKDLRAVLNHLADAGPELQRDYGGISKASVGVLLREMIQLEQQGAGALFGEPELEVADLMECAPDGRGRISVLELSDVQDRPAMFSTFMMWMLAELYHQLPEVGDVDKPKLVFFFDEAHLLFKDASKAFLDQVEQVVRLVRSKGVGIFFVTQSPKDIPADDPGPARQPGAARAAGVHARRRKGAARGGAHVPEDPVLRRRGDADHARDRRSAGHRPRRQRRPDPTVRHPRRPARLPDGPADARGDRAAARQRAGAEVHDRRRPRERLRDPGLSASRGPTATATGATRKRPRRRRSVPRPRPDQRAPGARRCAHLSRARSRIRSPAG